ncbi:hypothetical protein BS50DRAFT_639831 [Corynespora cassiicola Philippines]|uniref:Uncharacterized protein n=1 Tax=Corynespora cassiicola Philippines TaxID=1448308 RepID=A0A2T2N5R8_CORCC|nr:hypothetical protein BS50DRAFT_639831 [Corynespora cassiicola Philippines]
MKLYPGLAKVLWLPFVCVAQHGQILHRRFINGQPFDPLNVKAAPIPQVSIPSNTTLDLNARWDNPAPCKPDVWCAQVQKGALLLDAIKSDDKDAARILNFDQTAQSTFTDFPADFYRWHYFVWDAKEINRFYCNLERIWGLAAALEGIKVSKRSVDEGGQNMCYYVSHGWPWDDKYPDEKNQKDAKGQNYFNQGRRYKTTNANFVYSINHHDGLIIAIDRAGPAYTAPEFSKEALPKLQRASDILYGLWKYDFNEDDDDSYFRFYAVVSIVNKKTKEIIAYAIKDLNGGLPEWPGHEIYMNTDRGKALLATPNGFALAYALIQHKREFGKLKIVRVNLFKCNDYREHACMVFTLKEKLDSPEEDPNTKQPHEPPIKEPDDDSGNV